MKKVLFPILALVLALGLALPMAAGASPGPGIVGLWHFDEGEGSIAGDSSGYSNEGTLSGGKFGNALEFDGVDDYVLVGDIGVTGDCNWTVEFWANLASTDKTIYYPIGLSPGTSWGSGIYMAYTNDKWGVYDGSSVIWGSTSVSTNTWYHLAVTKSGTTYTLYLNGDYENSGTLTDIGISDLNIGRRSDEYWYFHGTIDEVRISNIARTTFDLTQAPSVDGGTVALWHFDESVGTTAYDCSGNGNDGTIHGAKWAGPTWVDGNFGKALSFDGVDDYVQVADDETLDITGAITMECWVKREQAAYQTLIAKWSAADDQRSYLLSLTSDNKVRFWTTSAGTWGTLQQLTSSGTVATEWTHIAATYDGNTMKIYINGGEDANEVSTTISIFGGTASLMFGVHPAYMTHGWAPAYFKGTIDEVRTWNEALTADQIALSYSGSVAWLPPVTNADFVLKDGTTLPLKFQLYENDTPVTTVQPVFLEVADGNGSVHRYELGDGVDNLRWNADESYYIANLKTKDGTWAAGEYTATVGGIVTGSILFELSPEKGVGRGNSGKP